MHTLVSSLADFVTRVSRIREDWKATPQNELWFRGETDADSKTPLTPKLYRSDKPIKELIDHEKVLFEEFQMRGVQFSKKDFDDAGWYFLMQHHGAPTRLLDWSDGALIALHFSLIERARSPVQTDPCVYVVDADWLSDDVPAIEEPEDDEDSRPLELYLPKEKNIDSDLIPECPLALDPSHFTRRVAAQRSQFVVFGKDADWLRKRIDQPRCRLKSIRIGRAAVPAMRSDLRASGITESVIFPDLDGLGREMTDLWNVLQAS
jgi:hypothetical protein